MGVMALLLTWWHEANAGVVVLLMVMALLVKLAEGWVPCSRAAVTVESTVCAGA